MTLHLWDQMPHKHFWGVNRHFQTKHAKSKNAYFRNYCINSNKILHNNKDHQMLFVGGPNAHIINLRWWTAAVLKKMINRYIAATV